VHNDEEVCAKLRQKIVGTSQGPVWEERVRSRKHNKGKEEKGS